MFQQSLHSFINVADNLVPPWLRRWIKRHNPTLIERFYRQVATHTSDEVLEVRVQGGPLRGRKFFCSLRHQRSCFLGNFEPLKARTLEQYLSPGDILFDVGGHIGYFSMVAAQRVRPTGRVIAFEPSPANATQFRENLAANNDLSSVVTLHEIAVADATGVTRFALGGNSYIGHLSDAEAEAAFDVQVTTLDDFAHLSGSLPHFVKIDAEGAEGKIFNGMRALLRDTRPTLLVEVHDEKGFSAFREVLEQYSYVSRRIDSDEPLSAAPVWLPESEYLAVPIERGSYAIQSGGKTPAK